MSLIKFTLYNSVAEVLRLKTHVTREKADVWILRFFTVQ